MRVSKSTSFIFGFYQISLLRLGELLASDSQVPITIGTLLTSHISDYHFFFMFSFSWGKFLTVTSNGAQQSQWLLNINAIV